MEIVTFGADNLENVFAKMSAKQLDNVSFGVLQVNEKGRILLFNATEGDIAGYEPKAAIGKNFFTDVAPCTNVAGFRGKFDAGVKSGNLNVVFEWHLAGGKAPTVQVHLKKALGDNQFWIFTKRL